MIEGYVGRPGAGKTYLMSDRCLRAIAAGRVVWSNYGLIGSRPFESWNELVEVRSAVVAVDEVGLWFSSRDWQSTPWSVLSWLAQSRKEGIELLWTAQSWEQVDVSLRRLTAYRWECCCWSGSLMIGTCKDPASNRCHGKVFRLRSDKVCRAYDTFRVLGDREGSIEARRGAAGGTWSPLDGCYSVWIDDFGVSHWRVSSVDDLLFGEVTIVQRENGQGPWITVPQEVRHGWHRLLVRGAPGAGDGGMDRIAGGLGEGSIDWEAHREDVLRIIGR